MKIGILCAIHPQESKVNWGGSPIDAYIRFFESTGVPFEYQGYEVAQGELPDSADECDYYVITGSPRGVYDTDPWIEPLMQFIRDGYLTGKKFVGICFGHQVLAEALGGHVQKSEKGWGLGLKSFEINNRKDWMGAGADQCSLYFAHQDQVITLPAGAELLGGNSFCPNGMYVVDGRVLGIQGHPEFDLPIMQSILENAKSGDDQARALVAETAVLSLDNGQPDNQIVARWIVDFLNQ